MELPSRMYGAGRLILLSTPYFLALAALVLNAGIGRPIWIDEVLHFVLAAEPTSGAAWEVASQTFGGINHGQTGIYMMLNYWTLSLTGADVMALRLPSLLSGAFMFAAAIFMFRVLGFSVAWQVVAVAALIGQHTLLYFAGEARPYMPLAAATVGMLAYYVARAHHPDSRAVLMLGTSAALLGVLMHPYFAVYWPAVCIVGWLHRQTATSEKFSLRALLRFANPPLVLGGAVIYLLLAAMTWLPRGPKFDFDPFQWVRQAGLWVTATDYSHTQFIGGSYGVAAAFTAGSILGLALLPARMRPRLGPLSAPVALILLAVGISALVSWLSYRAGYWILFRQWVASIALVAIGVVWLWAEVSRMWQQVAPPLGLAGVAIAAFVVHGQLGAIAELRLHQTRDALASQRATALSVDCTPPSGMPLADLPNDERNRVVVEAAIRNTRCGGPVWPAFQSFYATALGRPARQQATE